MKKEDLEQMVDKSIRIERRAAAKRKKRSERIAEVSSKKPKIKLEANGKSAARNKREAERMEKYTRKK